MLHVRVVVCCDKLGKYPCPPLSRFTHFRSRFLFFSLPIIHDRRSGDRNDLLTGSYWSSTELSPVIKR